MKHIGILFFALYLFLFPVFTTKNDQKAMKITEHQIILVNHDHPLPSSYVPSSLVFVPLPSIREIYLDSTACTALIDVFQQANIRGFHFVIFSGYRSYQYQETIYEENEYQAKPGESEHQTGLAVDISLKDVGLIEELAGYGEYQWFKEEMISHGFILRYPKGKEYITHYAYEPWHFRYVGKIAANYIDENQLTLEEYLQQK